MANIKKFEHNIDGAPIALMYNLDKLVVRIVCERADVSSAYLTKLILSKKIGAVDSIIYSPQRDSVVVALMRGVHMNKFLRSPKAAPDEPSPKTRKSFSQLAEKES